MQIVAAVRSRRPDIKIMSRCTAATRPGSGGCEAAGTVRAGGLKSRHRRNPGGTIGSRATTSRSPRVSARTMRTSGFTEGGLVDVVQVDLTHSADSWR